MAFIEGAVAFVGGAVTFVGEGAVTSVEGAVTSVEGAVTFVGGAVTSVEGAVTFVEGSLAVGRLFKTARVGVGNERDLKRRLITYELKGPSLSIYSLISTSNYSIGSSL